MASTLPDHMSREPAKLAGAFEHWGKVDAPSVGSPLYAELGQGVSRDPELLRLAAETRPYQPAPNMLFAAVQYLLLGGVRHELSEHYPILAKGPGAPGSAFPKFRDFCVAHRDEIVPLPDLPASMEVVWRVGVDLNPVDVRDDDQVRWLRALIFPEHVERHLQLRAAIRIARVQPPRLVEGDAADRLPELLSEAPRHATLVVFATHALYQLPRDRLVLVLKSLQRHGERRPLFCVSMEGTAVRHSELFLTRYDGGARETIKLADCNPHGQWIEWQAA